MGYNDWFEPVGDPDYSHYSPTGSQIIKKIVKTRILFYLYPTTLIKP